MLDQHKILLFQEYNTCTVEIDRNTYTYKVPLDINIEVGDYVVVPCGETIKVEKVVAFNEPLDVTINCIFKWIVQKVDVDAYKERCERDKKMDEIIRHAGAKKLKQELKEQIQACLPEEELKLLESL